MSNMKCYIIRLESILLSKKLSQVTDLWRSCHFRSLAQNEVSKQFHGDADDKYIELSYHLQLYCPIRRSIPILHVP